MSSIVFLAITLKAVVNDWHEYEHSEPVKIRSHQMWSDLVKKLFWRSYASSDFCRADVNYLHKYICAHITGHN